MDRALPGIVPDFEMEIVDVDEIYFFQVSDGKLVGAFGVEGNLSRLRQLGLTD